MKELIGSTIKAIYVDTQNQECLSFETDKGVFNYYVWGDCCSNSYFSDVVNVDFMLSGKKVLDVEEMQLQQGEFRPMKNDSDECISLYGYRLTIGDDEDDILGCGIVMFRNASNGYYGGSCDLLKGELPPGLVKITTNYFGD